MKRNLILLPMLFLAMFVSANVMAQEKMSVPKRISDIVKEIGYFEVTVWDRNKKWVLEGGTQPYEVIVNTPELFSHCIQAKNALSKVMKQLYTDPAVKDKIARVRFNAAGFIRSSVGGADGREVAGKLSFTEVGPTIFWQTLLKSPERESGPLQGRTWGVSINNCK